MNYKMKIFKAEKLDGISEQVRACSSIAYVTQLQPLDPKTAFAKRLVKTVASAEHPSETLYPMKDILVSTGKNLNLDIFDNGETWIARNTSNHHPLNFEHDEKRIIGNITNSQAVDDSMKSIDEDSAIDELPTKFHILNGSVIYRVWNDEAQQKLIDLTIAEIERGEWFVSMECVFKGFDYGVTRPDGSSAVITRNEESAFLTKHLRQYGGDGVYKDANSGQEFEIGRVLRNISFSGKGLVRKPANPESVILNHVSAFVSYQENLEYIKKEAEINSITSVEQPESKDMSEQNADMKKLEDRVAELLRANEALATQLRDKDDKAVLAKYEALESQISERDNKIRNLETSSSEMSETIINLTKRAEEAEAVKNTLEESLAAMNAEKVEQNRLAVLAGKGAPVEKAAELVKKFSKFSDEEFNYVVETLSAAWKKPEAKKPEDVINNAKPERDAAMATDNSQEDKSEERIAKAAQFIGGYLRYNKNVPASTGKKD